MSIVCQNIGNTFVNTELKKLVNVYQLQFLRFKPPGFGDYLRGCFSMCQFINTVNKFSKANLTFDMDLSKHPIGKYIIHAGPNPTIDYSKLGDFKINSMDIKVENPEDPQYQSMLQEIVYRMNSIKHHNGIYYGFCCKYEIYNEIKESDKEFIRSRLLPTPEMSSLITSTLLNLNLKEKEFSVLHVRCLDNESFPPKPLSSTYFATLDTLVEKHCDPSKKYLVLSNHNGVKEHYKHRPNFYSRDSLICHLGLDTDQKDDATRDTLLDFFLLRYACDCIGITPYGVCGFSQECCKLYNIPYTYVKFPDTNITLAHLPPAQRIAYDLLFRRH